MKPIRCHRLTRRALAFLILAGCATPAAPPPQAPAPPAPAPPPSARPRPPVPGDQPRLPGLEIVPPAEEATPLPWVNPARCLSPCNLDPGEDLVRIGADGGLAPQGEHRVAKRIVPHLRDLLVAAAAAGHVITVNSAFRSYDEQAHLFSTIKQPGRAARPGQSEHQLGTAVDLKLPSPEAGDWLARYAGQFGFALSYPPGKHKITGYRPEPWHVRFVGQALALELAQRGGTLEELFRERPALGVSGSCEDCPARARRKPCGKITAAGACKGVLLSWCYEGALATVDCSAFSQRCEATGAGEFDCR
jgi:D-alanyl-D-alanine carboxypeptidase